MKILIINGSPRLNGNTKTALKHIVNGIDENIKHSGIEILDVVKLKLSGCLNCDSCKKNGGECILPDDSSKIIEKIAAADIIIFGTPVYWWGISSQLKMIIDKFYSKSKQFHEQNKKIGIISVGASEIDDKQYKLISDQFKCICDYLGWDIILDEAISAYDLDDLKQNEEKCKELRSLWKSIEAI